MVDTFAVSKRLAGMLLLGRDQITLEEIQALPFVESRDEAFVIAQELLRSFGPSYRMEVDLSPRDSNIKLRLALPAAALPYTAR